MFRFTSSIGDVSLKSGHTCQWLLHLLRDESRQSNVSDSPNSHVFDHVSLRPVRLSDDCA